MKSTSKLVLKALYTLFLVSISIASTANSSVNFIKGSWSDAVTLSKQTGKPIFLDCYTTWCKPCKQMDKEAFINSAVAKYYNEHFIAIKMDMETEEGVMLKERYNVNAYPTLLYINTEEKLLHRESGYKYGAPKSLINIGKDALNPKKRSERLKFEYDNGNRDPKFLLEYSKQIKETYQFKPEVFDAYLATINTEKKLGSKKTRKHIYKYITSSNSHAYELIMQLGYYPETQSEEYTLISCLLAGNQPAIKTKNDSMYQANINKAYSVLPHHKQQIHIFLTVPYYSETKQLNILHDSTKNYIGNNILDSMTGKRFIMEMRDPATPLPYNPEEYETEYSYFSEDGRKPKKQVLDYNATAWRLNKACGIYTKTIKDTNALRDAKLWMEIALTIEEVPQYLNTYAFILYNLNMKDEALEVLNRLRTLLEEHPEYGQYDEAMQVRDKLYKEKD